MFEKNTPNTAYGNKIFYLLMILKNITLISQYLHSVECSTKYNVNCLKRSTAYETRA